MWQGPTSGYPAWCFSKSFAIYPMPEMKQCKGITYLHRICFGVRDARTQKGLDSPHPPEAQGRPGELLAGRDVGTKSVAHYLCSTG